MSSRAALLSLVAVAAIAATGCEPSPPAYPTNDDYAAPAGAEGDGYADTDPSALSDFREPLAGHGTWMDHPTYGTVWVPDAKEVGPDFAPYVTAGHWAYDEGEYVWVSDYSWGWAPFHYGRWAWADGAGWVWVPGRVYAGAWVVWRVGDDGYDYVGWAPMPPYWIWSGGYVVAIAVYPAPFVFLPRGHMFATGVSTHLVAHERAVEIGGRTHVYAQPGAATHAMAHPVGPSPQSLGHDPARVPHTAAGDPGVARARAYGKPSSSASFGAKPSSRGGGRGRPGSAPHAPARGGGGRRH